MTQVQRYTRQWSVLAILGVLLLATVLLLRARTAEGGDDSAEPACFASHFGLPCR